MNRPQVADSRQASCCRVIDGTCLASSFFVLGMNFFGDSHESDGQGRRRGSKTAEAVQQQICIGGDGVRLLLKSLQFCVVVIWSVVVRVFFVFNTFSVFFELFISPGNILL